MLPQFPKFLEKVYAKYNCNRFIHLGDLVDNAAISYHEKHPGLSSAPEEYKKAKKQIQELVKRFPKADLLLGNHDALGERQAKTIGLLPEWLRDFNDIWGLPKSWTVHPRFHELEVDGTIFMHGDSGKGGQFGAMKTAMAKFQNVVAGHLHGEAGAWYYANGNARVFGMNAGCGVDHKALSQEYGRKFTKKPIVGCGVLLDGLPCFIPMEI
jgi:hypothetical protein